MRTVWLGVGGVGVVIRYLLYSCRYKKYNMAVLKIMIVFSHFIEIPNGSADILSCLNN